MIRLLPRLDPTGIQLALKTCLALALDLAIAFQLDWKPSYGAILVVVLQTAAVGATYKKGVRYVIGTLGGAVAGLAMVGLFDDSRGAFILGMAALIGFSTYRMQGSANAYAWLIFLVTATLVGYFSVQNPASGFDNAVMRSSTICMGTTIAFLVHGTLWPIRAGDAFEHCLRESPTGCRNLLSFTRRALAGESYDLKALKKAEAAQFNTMATLHDSLDTAAADTGRFHHFRSGYQQLVDELDDLLMAVLALQQCTLQASRDPAGELPLPNSDDLCASLEIMEREMEALAHDLCGPRDGSAGLPETDALSCLDMEESDKVDAGKVDTLTAASITGCVRVLASRLSKARRTANRVEDPQTPVSAPPPQRAPSPPMITRLWKPFAAGLVALVLPWFFILTNWPMGLQLSMVFAAIVIGLGNLMPVMMVSGSLILSLVIGAAIAAPLYFGIMPGIDRYEQLMPWLLAALFPLLYLMTRKNPKTMLMAMFSAIHCITLLSLDETGQSYTFSSFITMWFGLCGGFGGALILYSLFSAVVPEREFRKQVYAFFSGSNRIVRDPGKSGSPNLAEKEVAKGHRQQWLGQLKLLRLWSSQIDHRRLPKNDVRKTMNLIASIERTMLGLACLEDARRDCVDGDLEHLRGALERLEGACADSFRSIAGALKKLAPVPDIPDTGSLMADLQSKMGVELRDETAGDDQIQASPLRVMRIATHLYALTDSLRDCREAVNALDWEAWSRNYF